MAEDFKNLSGKLVKSAKGAGSVEEAAAKVLAGIVNEIRVHREDGPALEALSEQLDEAQGDLSAAIASKA